MTLTVIWGNCDSELIVWENKLSSCGSLSITHQRIHQLRIYYIIAYFFFIKTFKMLLHVSILRLSSGSTYFSLTKLHVKIVNTSLKLSVMWQHIVCLCMCCFQCRVVCVLAYSQSTYHSIVQPLNSISLIQPRWSTWGARVNAPLDHPQGARIFPWQSYMLKLWTRHYNYQWCGSISCACVCVVFSAGWYVDWL